MLPVHTSGVGGYPARAEFEFSLPVAVLTTRSSNSHYQSPGHQRRAPAGASGDHCEDGRGVAQVTSTRYFQTIGKYKNKFSKNP